MNIYETKTFFRKAVKECAWYLECSLHFFVNKPIELQTYFKIVFNYINKSSRNTIQMIGLLENVMPEFKDHSDDNYSKEQNSQRIRQQRCYRKLLSCGFDNLSLTVLTLVGKHVRCRLVDVKFASQAILIYFTSRTSLL